MVKKGEYHGITFEKYGPLAEKVINFIYSEHTNESLTIEEIGVVMAALQSIILGMRETLEKNGGGFGFRRDERGLQ